MLPRLLLVLLAATSLGFVVTTPESRREQARARRAWHQETRARWDRAALHAFLVRTLAGQDTMAGVTVTPRETGRRFTPDHARYLWKSGRWLFVCRDPAQDHFELRRPLSEQGWLVLECQRERRDQFRVIATSIDPLVTLCPPPWSLAP